MRARGGPRKNGGTQGGKNRGTDRKDRGKIGTKDQGGDDRNDSQDGLRGTKTGVRSSILHSKEKGDGAQGAEHMAETLHVLRKRLLRPDKIGCSQNEKTSARRSR